MAKTTTEMLRDGKGNLITTEPIPGPGFSSELLNSPFQPERSKREDYPNGSIWQDDSSLKDDGKVDFYVMNDRWEFLRRDMPLNYIGRYGALNTTVMP